MLVLRVNRIAGFLFSRALTKELVASAHTRYVHPQQVSKALRRCHELFCFAGGTMFKAIETVYNGYRFRSRLEARWAVFFDTLGIKYEYEKEGFDLNGVWYLPDFWWPEMNIWVEIKPTMPDERSMEIETYENLAQLGEHPVVLIAGQPGVEPGDYSIRLFYPDGREGHDGRFVQARGLYTFIAYTGYQGIRCEAHLDESLLAARQARFEHGEKP
jgi:hypothetical protein